MIIQSLPNLIIKRYIELFLQATVEYNSICGKANFSYEWNFVSINTFLLDPISKYTPKLYIPPNTLIPGQTYSLQLLLIVNNNQKSIIFF